MTAVKKAAPAKSAARTSRSAKATGAAKAGSHGATAKPTGAAAATKVAKSAHTNNSTVTSAAKSANNSTIKRAAKPAPKSAASSAGGPAKRAARAVDQGKPQASSTKKVAPAKKAAPSVNSTTKSNSSTSAPPAKKTATVGPYAKEPKFLEEQQALLLEERGIYQGQAEDLQAEADSLAQEREPGDVQFDEESGEGGTVTVDRERDLALSAQALLAVEEIDDAQRKIDRKTYGACERCHEPIPKARLRALPFARLCVACKSGGLSRR